MNLVEINHDRLCEDDHGRYPESGNSYVAGIEFDV